MKGSSLARRYARAQFQIGQKTGSQEILAKELEDLAGSFEASSDLREALLNPAISETDRRRVLEAILTRMAASDSTKHLALVLLERERVDLLPDVAHELRHMVDEAAGRVRGEVTSARPLAPETVTRIQSALESITSKKVILSTRQDPSLIGGVVARVGDLVFDGSLARQLEEVREDVIES